MQWTCDKTVFHFDGRPLLMGVVNVTPDSFSDGGNYLTANKAIAHGLQLIEDGADIVDVGGESSRPGATPVSVEEEKKRILPVIEGLAKTGATVSVDTMKPTVMRAAVDFGAAIINDVSGFGDAASADLLTRCRCGLVVMHMRGDPQTMQHDPQYDDVVGEVSHFLADRLAYLTNLGVDAKRICVDPGIGFGKTLTHNLKLLNNLPALCPTDHPVLVGVSRKSLFSPIAANTSADERDMMSATAAALLAVRGAHILRVHHVKMTKQALAVADLLREEAHV